MKSHERFIWRKASFAAAVLAVVLMSAVPAFSEVLNPNEAPSVQAAASEDLRAASTQVGNTVLIPMAAFATDGAASGTYMKYFATGYVIATSATPACLLAPVVFPKGAKKIKKAYVYVQDGSASVNATITLKRTNLLTGITADLGSVLTSDTSAITEYEIPVSDPSLSNDYTFYITMCLYQDIRLYGAKVIYKPAQ